MSKSNKFFFRAEGVGNDPEAFVDVPEDLTWAINEGKPKPVIRVVGGALSGSGSIGASTGYVDQGYDASYPYPNTKIGAPVIRGIAKQEVSQDPEGKGTIDVTFIVEEPEQTSVEWEVRITR